MTDKEWIDYMVEQVAWACKGWMRIIDKDIKNSLEYHDMKNYIIPDYLGKTPDNYLSISNHFNYETTGLAKPSFQWHGKTIGIEVYRWKPFVKSRFQ